MREIVLDTETTGLDPLGVHRIVEIGAVELLNRSLTDRMSHCGLNPERAMLADPVAVYGLAAEFLDDRALLYHVTDAFLAFVGDASLVAHNAGFDIAFLNAALKRAAKPQIVIERVVDTAKASRRTDARRPMHALIARAARKTARCSTPSC